MNETTLTERQPAGGLLSVEQERALGEVQAQVIMAKRFPRNEDKARDAILKACTRKSLADSAMYAYPRGGTEITGPSIRLAECIAQKWQNLDFGIREISRNDKESVCEAYAWDLETNSRQRKIFMVPHVRWAKGRANRLEVPRDIYEMIANMGARRLRACILGIIPGDVTEEAVQQCELTQRHHEGDIGEAVKKMADAFAKYGVTKEMLEKRLGHNLEATIGAELAPLRRVYNSLKDGMSKVADWFGTGEPEKPETDDLTDEIRSGKPASEAKPATEFTNWPKRTGDGPLDWTDAAGERYDREAHGWNAKDQMPAVRQDGTFKARRGTGSKAKQPEPVAGESQQSKSPNAETVFRWIREAVDEEELSVCEDALRDLSEGERRACQESINVKRKAFGEKLELEG